MRRLVPLLLLCACGAPDVSLPPFDVQIDGSTGRFDIDHEELGLLLQDVQLSVGTGDATVQSSFGAFRFDDVTLDLTPAARIRSRRSQVGPQLLTLEDADGNELATATIGATPVGPRMALALDISPSVQGNRIALSGACTDDDHFLGLGSHAQDVDHVGQAFPIFVSEPGIGKTDTEEPPDDWFVTGTRHASSYPVPFFVRPHANHAVLIDTQDRVEVDLCASDPERFDVVSWTEGPLRIVLFASPDPVELLQQHMAWTGRPQRPPEWAMAPWNDAIEGADNVRDVATTLRDAGAVSGVIWTEDWKGGELTNNGYRVSGEWDVDRELYPDPEGIADELNAQGFRWFAYFAPYVREGTRAWEQAFEADAVVVDANGEPLTFSGPSFETEVYLDLTSQAGRNFATDRMRAAVDVGFDGWMADFAEWLPLEARLADGRTGTDAHNGYPVLWQEANASVTNDADATFFARSGFNGAQQHAPIVWGGDQRTDFQADDGFPTVVPLGIGASVSGVALFTHDVAGYNSVGNPASTQELWFRWAWLGAFSPILRTHHGAFLRDNHQFNTNDETLQHWVTVTQEHTRLFPYRYGLAARASDTGVPAILPIGFRYDADYGRMDAWLLGDALLVAPVMQAGATERQVDLPDDVQWYDWFTDEPVQSGVFAADVDAIPVFAASGTIVPLLAQVPDTLDRGLDAVVDLDDVDGAREVRIYGDGGLFTEADGTTYTTSGTATGNATATDTLTQGDIIVGGLTVTIEGPIERAYTVRVISGSSR